MYVRRARLLSAKFPETDQYPYNQAVLRDTTQIEFVAPVSFFIGQNGSGKSTLLEAIARSCGVHIWRNREPPMLHANPFAESLHYYVRVEWVNGRVPGAFFASADFQHFSHTVDQWAIEDRDVLQYYGGQSLLVQSHGESILAYLRARCQRRGIYFMDEPETALSPQSQVALVRLVRDAAATGRSQFIIATHSPIMLACPGAVIYTFDRTPVTPVAYSEAPVVRVYREFLADPARALDQMEV